MKNITLQYLRGACLSKNILTEMRPGKAQAIESPSVLAILLFHSYHSTFPSYVKAFCQHFIAISLVALGMAFNEAA